MNEYDLAALKAIRDYHKQHGSYPKFVEATAEYRAQMSLQTLVCLDAIGSVPLATLLGKTLQPIETKQTNIPVVPLGTCDIVYRGILIRNTDGNLEKAECATHEQFQRIGAKLARAGCLLLGEKSSWGLRTYNPQLYFHQIIAYVFGEESVLEEVLSNHSAEKQ